MPNLNQILAIESTVKKNTDRVFTEGYHNLQKSELLEGISRSYTPKDDEGEALPGEVKLVQVTVSDVVDEVKSQLTNLFETTAQKDWANTQATADIVVDDEVIFAGVPVTYLLFLEKQITDLTTVFVKNVPTLSPEFEWVKDENTGAWFYTITTTRSKKVPFNHVKYEATPEHPAQVEVYQEDRIVGTWNTTKYSGAVPAMEVHALADRLSRLLKAVKFAREQANGTNAPIIGVSEKLLDYIFPNA